MLLTADPSSQPLLSFSLSSQFHSAKLGPREKTQGLRVCDIKGASQKLRAEWWVPGCEGRESNMKGGQRAPSKRGEISS